MHHSEDPNKKALALTCYLDESGTDKNNDPNNITAVMGGIVLDKDGFLAFGRKWQKLLRDNQNIKAIHMKEFGLHGRLGHFNEEGKRVLFTEAANIVNRYKIQSIDVSINKKQFDNCVPEIIAKYMGGFYGFCFQLFVESWHRYSIQENIKDSIAYLLDDGNEYKQYILYSYDAMLRFQRDKSSLHVGSLSFDDDEKVSALQAADIISWGARRIQSTGILKKGFEPIHGILTKNHLSSYWDKDMLRGVCDYIMPFLQDMARCTLN
jgi:hypothetical protein